MLVRIYRQLFSPRVCRAVIISSVKERSSCLKSEPPLECDQERSKKGRNGREKDVKDGAGLGTQEQVENVNE